MTAFINHASKRVCHDYISNSKDSCPNGAGKSTVMGMISRLLQRDSGLIEFEGKDIKGMPFLEFGRGSIAGYVTDDKFQNQQKYRSK